MPLSNNKKQQIVSLLNKKISQKLNAYGRETTAMPFLARLIQDNEKIAAYSFIHSMATTLGMSIYEEISVIIAKNSTTEAFRNYGVGGVISTFQKTTINDIVTKLRNGSISADINTETEAVLQALSNNAASQKSGNIADFYMKRDNKEYYFEIKTAKPNIDVFEKSKTKLLEWIARRRLPVKVYLALPYNPYHPKPYNRFTEVNMMDIGNDFLVGDEYWDFLGGKNTFAELLAIFDKVGKKFKKQLDDKFKQIAAEKINTY